MKEISASDINNINNDINNNISDIKIYPTKFPTKEIQNYNISTISKKNNLSNNNITFKITEKECSDINSIVRTSVEKINDLLNSKEFTQNNFSKTLKRSSKNCIAEILEKEKEKEKILKSKTLKETGMKTNFTFNINNFINVPNDQTKNESINLNKKTERDEDEEFVLVNEQTFSEKNKNTNSCKTKTHQKGTNCNNRIKNNSNYVNYGTNRHNNGKIFRNCVRKKKLFDDGMNSNYNNNINIVNYTNGKKNKKSRKIDTKEDKDKSITVNTKNKKNGNINDNNNINNDNYMINKDKNLNPNPNSLNNSLKNRKKEINNNILKYSISDEVNNSKIQSINKGNFNLNNFSPNIININSLSYQRNLKDYILNNNKDIEKYNKNNKQNNNNSISKYNNNNRKKKSKEKEINKKVFTPPYNNRYKPYLEEKYQENNLYYNNINFINNKNEEKNNFKKYKNSSFPLNNPINNQQYSNKNINKSSFSKTFSTKNNCKYIPINNININNNDSFSNIDENYKKKSINNKPDLKRDISGNIKKCGYSCEHFHKNYSQNTHQILNKIYSKDFPNKIKTNNMMKLMLFLNEYLINNNLLDDYYDVNNRNKLDFYSKFLCEQINIDFPQEDDVNIDKMVNSAKKIQRMWRKKKIEKHIGKKNEENELKKMVINKYVRNAGFKIKKIFGLFNSLVEDFNNIGNEQEMEEMFYNIQKIIKRKLTPYEKNNLYKEYINTIIYSK